jgi:hypothetical protein
MYVTNTLIATCVTVFEFKPFPAYNWIQESKGNVNVGMTSLIISLSIELCGVPPFDAREKGGCVPGVVSNVCTYILKLLPILIIGSVLCLGKGKGKGKSVPLQAWSSPEGSSKLRFPDYMTTAQDGGKVVSLTHRPPFPPGNAPGTHFC